MLYLGSDHAGFHLKEAIKKYLQKQNYAFQDLGNTVFDPEDDFPDFAEKVARACASSPKHRGLLFCGSAIGMVIAANKIKNVRAGHIFNIYTARQSREHDNTNIAVFAGKLTPPHKAYQFVKIWLKTNFSRKEKYRRRVKKMNTIG